MNIADTIERAADYVTSEFGLNTRKAGDPVWYTWKDAHKGPAVTKDGFTYMSQGVAVVLDDCTVVVRAFSSNGMNCGEVKLTGFAALSAELIAGAIETALESI